MHMTGMLNPGAILFGALFLTAGLLFAAGKVHERLPFWKRMPETERQKIRIRPLCRNIGEMILLSGLLLLMDGFWPRFREHWFAGVMAAWMAAAALDVWLIGRSSRYRQCGSGEHDPENT